MIMPNNNHGKVFPDEHLLHPIPGLPAIAFDIDTNGKSAS